MAEEKPVTAAPEAANANETEPKQTAEPSSELGTTTTETKETEQAVSETGKPEIVVEGKEYQKLRQRAQEAERRAAYLEGMVEGARKPEPAPQKPVPQTEPTIDQFDDYDKFVVAKATYTIREENKQAEQQRVVQEVENKWQERLRETREKIPDFQEVLRTTTAPVSDAMIVVMKDSEYGPQIAYHLAKNPQEAHRISQLSPVSMAREMGKLEVKLTAQTDAPKPNKITQAPEPITPGGNRIVNVTTELDKTSIDDFMKRRNEETFVKAGSRLIPKR